MYKIIDVHSFNSQSYEIIIDYLLILPKVTSKQNPATILISKTFWNAINKLHVSEMRVQQFSSCELLWATIQPVCKLQAVS